MPRATKSKISEIVNAFRTCSLEVMDVMKELVDDVVRERKGKSTKAKQRAALPAATTSTAIAGPVAAPRKKVARKVKPGGKKRGPKPRNQLLPLDQMIDTAGANDDQGDVAVNMRSTAPSGQPVLTAP